MSLHERIVYNDKDKSNNHNVDFLNQARAWFFEITFMRACMCVCVRVCMLPRS